MVTVAQRRSGGLVVGWWCSSKCKICFYEDVDQDDDYDGPPETIIVKVTRKASINLEKSKDENYCGALCRM